jgi:hypothetical protein
MYQNVGLFTIIFVTFLCGFVSAKLFDLRKHNTCLQIARFHQDYLIEKYNLQDGFNTNMNHPQREINQRASQLNAKLLELCSTDPTL